MVSIGGIQARSFYRRIGTSPKLFTSLAKNLLLLMPGSIDFSAPIILIFANDYKGDIAMVERLLTQAQQGEDKEKAKEIMKLRGYLMDNCYGLRNYHLEVNGVGLRELRAMEGNLDKLFADRMKKRGMSWTKKGANRMSPLESGAEPNG